MMHIYCIRTYKNNNNSLTNNTTITLVRVDIYCIVDMLLWLRRCLLLFLNFTSFFLQLNSIHSHGILPMICLLLCNWNGNLGRWSCRLGVEWDKPELRAPQRQIKASLFEFVSDNRTKDKER